MKNTLNKFAEHIEKHKVAYNVACYGIAVGIVLTPRINQAVINYHKLQQDAAEAKYLLVEMSLTLAEMAEALPKEAA